MKILLDECLPRKLKHDLPGYEVRTVPEMGWAGKKNGELLKLMTDHFQIFITVDNNLQHQHTLSGLTIAFVVLVAHNSKLATLRPLMPKVIEILESIQSGNIVEVRESTS